MKSYQELCRYILDNGVVKKDRTGTGTISVFDTSLRFDLSKGFPAATTKKLYLKGIIHELLWFLRGDTNIKYLVDNGVSIWTRDAYSAFKIRNPNSELTLEEFEQKIKELPSDHWFVQAYGNLGNVYGAQWRKWRKKEHVHIDQLQDLIHTLKTNPDSRRMLVSAWNVGELDSMALPPCHFAFQCYVANGKLSLKWYQRSVDVFLGLAFNIASYAILTHMLAQLADLEVGELIFNGGDTHIYLNHIDQVNLQLTREPYTLPTIELNKEIKRLEDFKYEDIRFIGYQSHPAIKGEQSF